MSRSKLLVLVALLSLLALPVGTATAQEVTEGATGTAVIWDDQSLSNAITFSMTGVTAPSEGTAYEGWLVSDTGAARISLGILSVADDGSVNHTYSSTENLISTYNRVDITVELVPDSDSGPSDSVLASHQIQPQAMSHIRHLLSDWPEGSGIGILTNLKTQIVIAKQHADLANSASSIEDVKKHIEHVINAIEGPEGSNYGDLDKNGAVEDFGDGVGVLSHAANRSHADLAITASGDTVISDHGNKVLEYGSNASTWAEQAVVQAIRASEQTDINLAKVILAGSIGLLDSALNGIVATGQGGASQAYVEAQLMATYTLVPGNVAAPTPPSQPTTVEPPSSGEVLIPQLAQMGLALSVMFFLFGGALLAVGRKSNT